MSETSELELVEIKLELASSPEMVEIDMPDTPTLELNSTDAMPHPDEIAQPVLEKGSYILDDYLFHVRSNCRMMEFVVTKVGF